MFEYFKSMRWIALWLGILCISVFVFQNLFPWLTQELVLTKDFVNKPWQIVTNIFAHANVMHLIYNLFALLLFGLILENIIGSRKFLILFIVSIVTTDIASLIFYRATLGISGIVYSILGAVAVLRPRMIVFIFGVPVPMFIAVFLWTLLDIAGFFYSSGIANATHLAGLITGIVFGLIMRKRESVKENEVFHEPLGL